MKKKMNNKGFSLVELIIVIAIMAVLMVVLAPQLLKYVEKTRLQKDNSAISEIANAVRVACADETIINTIDATGVTVGTVAHPANGAQTITFSTTGTALEKELADVIGSVVTSSTTYRNGGNLSITVKNNGGKVTIEVGNFYDKPSPDGTAEPKIF